MSQSKLLEILFELHEKTYNEAVDCVRHVFNVHATYSAILELFKSAVPNKRKVDAPIEADELGGWNACRTETLRNMEKL